MKLKRLAPIALVALALVLPSSAGATGASNPSCAAQFVTQFAGPGFGQDVSAEASTFGRDFGQETKSFGTAPHNECPS
jgi:predicted small secreted protein